MSMRFQMITFTNIQETRIKTPVICVMDCGLRRMKLFLNSTLVRFAVMNLMSRLYDVSKSQTFTLGFCVHSSCRELADQCVECSEGATTRVKTVNSDIHVGTLQGVVLCIYFAIKSLFHLRPSHS